MDAGMIGLGNLGSAVGNLIAENGFSVLGWEFNESVVQEINEQHTNARYLNGIPIHPNLTATTELDEVFKTCPVVFIAIPSIFIQSTLGRFQHKLPADLLFVNMAKGIDRKGGTTAFGTISNLFPDNPKIMLSGPAIANEFAHGMPTIVVLAGKNFTDQLRVSKMMDNDHFRTRFSDDEIGVELGGILKNIYAIGLGMFDGMQIQSINFRSVYLTLALEEMTRFGIAMGGKIETFFYLSGMGDLLATALSEHSHNRRMGEMLAQGFSLQEISEKMGIIPEGYNTLRTVLYYSEKLHTSMPLGKGLWDVMHGRIEASNFLYSFIRDFVDRGPRLVS